MKKMILGLIILFLSSAVSCSNEVLVVTQNVTITPTTTSPVPESANPAGYQELSFTLQIPEGNDSDAYDFPIYLKKYETLHLSFWLEEGSSIWFAIFTPSGKYFGLNSEGGFTEGSCARITSTGTFAFTPVQYECGDGYYMMEPHIISGASEYSQGGKARVRVQYWIEAEASPPGKTTPSHSAVTSGKSVSDITSDPSTYDGKEVELLGQTFLSGSPPKLLLDGKSGINLTGNTSALQKGFYRMEGVYDASINILNVTEAVEEYVDYIPIEAADTSSTSLTAVVVQGLVATPPKEVAAILTSYLSFPNLPENVPIYPYVVYGQDGFYLALSDTLIDLAAKFTFLYQGKDYSFTFSAGEVTGILVKTPLSQINFGSEWAPGEFGGVIIANTIAPLEAVKTTVEEINTNPGNYIFKRVLINGSYIVTTATVDYSDIKAPMGQGILADDFADLFVEDTNSRLETIDPNTRVWQLRKGEVTGTVIYPTDQILKYLDYSPPLSSSEITQRLKPTLIVDTIAEEVVQVADISELNPILGNPSQYWGKVVEFDGYALGINYPLKQVAKAIANTDIPVNVNLLAVGVADKPAIGSQLAIIGLNNDLLGEQGEVIQGRYKFKVAVTRIPELLVTGVPGADTAFFLLSKEELPS